MINRVVLVGRLTKDPELKYTPSGVATVRFTIAVNRPFKNDKGDAEADFITCVAWRKQAENLANFQKKGNLIGVEGRIQTGSYEGQDGKRVYTTDVVTDSIQFLERNNSGDQQQQSYTTPPQQQTQQHSGNGTASYSQHGNNYSQQGGTQYSQQHQNFSNSTNKGPVEVSDDDLPF